MKKWLLLSMLILGCSDSDNSISSEDSVVIDSTSDSASQSHDTTVVDTQVEQSDSCKPIHVADACSDVSCGAVKNGCGGFYFCVIAPASTCDGCQLQDGMQCPSSNPDGYKCVSDLLPIGCLDQGFGFWCCQEF